MLESGKMVVGSFLRVLSKFAVDFIAECSWLTHRRTLHHNNVTYVAFSSVNECDNTSQVTCGLSCLGATTSQLKFQLRD